MASNVMTDIANSFQNELVRTVPVLTGNLKNSLTVTAVGNKLVIQMLDYGEHIEFGTKFQRSNPFIRTAIFTKLNTYIKEALERYG